MRIPFPAGLAAVAAGLIAVAAGTGPAAAQPKTGQGPAPKYLYGNDVKVRPGGEKDSVKAIRVGIEWFQYDVAADTEDAKKTTPFVIAITEAGDIAVYPAGPVGADKTEKWLTGHDLRVRKAGEPEFTQKTKAWGVEVFRDLGSDQLLYVSEAKAIAFAPVPANLTTNKGRAWHHALEPRVRAPEQDTFENAKKFGLEVFQDENTNGLVYIAETGAISTAAPPTSKPDPKKPLGWKAAFGLLLRVRGADEPEFTDKTKKVPVEAITDETTGNLIYITDTGSLAVVPNPGKLADVKGPAALTWLKAMNLRARKGGEKEFDKARKFGIEIFRDNRTSNLLFVSETGAIAVLPK